MQVATIGVDLAKNIFQVHGITECDEVAFNRPLRRAQALPFFARLDPWLVGMEACSTSHYWARELTRLGHEVRLIPPRYVKPYVKLGKSDAIDAEAICEAVTRPTMRFVEIKSVDQQALLSLHRARNLMVRQRTQLVNALRSMLAEFGVYIARGLTRLLSFAQGVLARAEPGLPEIAQDVVHNLCGQLQVLHGQVRRYEARLRVEGKRDARVSLLQTIPGVGVVTASAIAASIGSGHQFKNGREFAAWLGLTPANRSSGGKERLGRITKMGDQYLRQLLVVGMTSLVRQTKSHPERANKWLAALLERKPARLATVAMANKTARIVWAVLTKNKPYMPRTL
ncbi:MULTISPECIES: IS110 family transposase [unclassified Leisingera]|uniref:IS110 family transposase n=1 Tax=unclassified Leisingera TaxID=2614906 RepID=UPI00101127F7|nr:MULTISPECIES: IS110 family transposase [unclassified Leisingera]MCF6433439.1 IS110 family transposase [Leisingera sp. MMG026]QAX31514.1 IS110 family transposase [Leisingera sp. NJS204]